MLIFIEMARSGKKNYIKYFLREAFYPAHLTDHSFLKKSSNFNIENIGGFSRDGGVASHNPLPRVTFDPGKIVAFPGNINATLTGANFPITVLAVSPSATQHQ